MHLEINKKHTKKLILLTLLLIVVANICFMLKLPIAFREIDKEMHFLFYFFAAAFFNFVFSKGKLINHITIFMLLIGFGFFIEFFQQYSNRFFHKRIHGNFDIQDIKYNILGILLFSVIWIKYYILKYFFKSNIT